MIKNTVFSIVLASSMATANANELPAEPVTVGEAFANAMQSHSLFALGDVHGSKHIVTQLMQLLEDPEYWQKVDDLVVEFGNARHQVMADRFILEGEQIPLQQVRGIWRDTLYFMAWQYDVYERLVIRLQQLNQQRAHKVRLVLAEPSLDWQNLTTEQWQQAVDERELGYFNAVKNQVLAKNRSAILLFGAFHTIEKPVKLANKPEPFSSVVALLEQQKAHAVFSVWPRLQGDGSQLPAGDTSSIYLLANTKLGAKALRDITSRLHSNETLSFADASNGYLLLPDASRDAQYSKAALSDQQWHAEMRRRAAIIPGRPKMQITKWLKQHSQ